MNKIKKYREENGMSLNDLSQKTNINYNTLRSYEYGYRDIKKMNIETALKLTRVLKISINDLIDK
jgi:DNA-binding XRE family transcriptional regulator